VASIVEGTEPLFENLEEVGEIPAPGMETRQPTGLGVGVVGLAEGKELLAGGADILASGESGQSVEGFFGGWERLRRLGNLDEDVEVIGHHTEGKDAKLAELGEFTEEGTEKLLFGVTENRTAIDDAREAVIDGARMVIGSEPTRSPHAGRTRAVEEILQENLDEAGIDCLSLGNRRS